MTLSQLFLDARIKKGISQQAVADAVRSTQGTISKIEKGQIPAIPIAFRLARFYGITYCDLEAAIECGNESDE